MIHHRHWTVLAAPGGEEDQAPIAAGDWVSTGLNIVPLYQVIAVSGDKAWIRDAERGGDAIAVLSRCHRIGAAEAARLC